MKTDQDLLPTSSDIRLDELSPTEWRVCDSTIDEDDHLSILGFIELRDRKYEVLRMSAPRDVLVFGTLAEARNAFSFSSISYIP